MNKRKQSSKEIVGEIMQVLKKLHVDFPTQSIGKHISEATTEHNLWLIPDKELLFVLNKYQIEKSNNIPSNKEVEELEKISKRISIDDLIDEEEQEDNYGNF